MTKIDGVVITHPRWCTEDESPQLTDGYFVVSHQSAPHPFHTGFDDDRDEDGSVSLRWFEWVRGTELPDGENDDGRAPRCPPFIAGLDEYGDVLPMKGAAELAQAITHLLTLAEEDSR